MSEQKMIIDLIKKMHDRIDQVRTTQYEIHAGLLQEIRVVQTATAALSDSMDDIRRHIRNECQAFLQRDAMRQKEILNSLSAPAFSASKSSMLFQASIDEIEPVMMEDMAGLHDSVQLTKQEVLQAVSSTTH